MTTAAPEERRRRYVRPGASILAAVVVTAALVATQTVADLVNVFLLNGRFWILDASSESGLGARVSAGAIAAAALLVGVRAIVDRDRRVLNALIAVALGFLALDDTVGLHERLIQALTRLLSTPRAVDDWPTAVVYAPLLLFVAVAVWRDSIRGTARLLARAGIVVLGAALALRVLGAAIMLEGGYSPRLALRAIAAAAQQGLELGGFLLLAFAFHARVRFGSMLRLSGTAPAFRCGVTRVLRGGRTRALRRRG